MRPWWILVFAACGPSVPKPQGPGDQWATDAAHAVVAGDVSTIRGYLRDSVDFGGIWFPDAACHQEFLIPRTIPDAELDAFARCLAGLHLAVSDRVTEIVDLAAFTYAPGLEIQARFAAMPGGVQLVWVAYDGSADGRATLPTVTPAALEALRSAGDPSAIDDAGRPVLDAAAAQTKRGAIDAWFQVCVDRDGAVTGAHLLATTTAPPDAIEAWRTTIKAWHFQPFVLTTPSPMCAWVQVADPPDKLATLDHVLPIPPLEQDVVGPVRRAISVPTIAFQPVRNANGEVIELHIVSTIRFCIDPAGRVTKESLYLPSGFPAYDRVMLMRILRSRYDKADAPSCTSQTELVVVRERSGG